MVQGIIATPFKTEIQRPLFPSWQPLSLNPLSSGVSSIELFPHSIILHSKAQRGIYLAKDGRLIRQHWCVRNTHRLEKVSRREENDIIPDREGSISFWSIYIREAVQ